MSPAERFNSKIIESLKKIIISKKWVVDWDGWLERQFKKLKERLGKK
jgi:hypothetical protein